MALIPKRASASRHRCLEDYRIIYFATHGLLAGEVAKLAKLNAEPALVLSLPDNPTPFDDGLLTASEAAQLKLNADWVVLSACNTASGDGSGVEALWGSPAHFSMPGGDRFWCRTGKPRSIALPSS
jgi:CHAT domain-containing protein